MKVMVWLGFDDVGGRECLFYCKSSYMRDLFLNPASDLDLFFSLIKIWIARARAVEKQYQYLYFVLLVSQSKYSSLYENAVVIVFIYLRTRT